MQWRCLLTINVKLAKVKFLLQLGMYRIHLDNYYVLIIYLLINAICRTPGYIYPTHLMNSQLVCNWNFSNLYLFVSMSSNWRPDRGRKKINSYAIRKLIPNWIRSSHLDSHRIPIHHWSFVQGLNCNYQHIRHVDWQQTVTRLMPGSVDWTRFSFNQLVPFLAIIAPKPTPTHKHQYGVNLKVPTVMKVDRI